jgi:Uma2 family endonuclease
MSTISAEEFLKFHGDDSGFELVRGRIVPVDEFGGEHGEVCGTAIHYIGSFVKSQKLGRMACNDTFIYTTWNPDSIRGADLCFISYATLPASHPTPKGAVTPPLELVVEVRSPSNSIRVLTNKATEYLSAGVKVVMVLDPNTESAAVFRADELPQRFHNGDELTLPDILPGFAVPVAKFFE